MSNTGEEPPKEKGSQTSSCMFVAALPFGLVALITGLSTSANTQGWGNIGIAIIFQVTFFITAICLIIGLIARSANSSK
jgi:tellurite resistance protein TehA-like permease